MNDDLISRQQAIKAVGFMENKNGKLLAFADEYDEISRIKAMIVIANLPSVKPKIQAKTIEDLLELFEPYLTTEDLLECIGELKKDIKGDQDERSD